MRGKTGFTTVVERGIRGLSPESVVGIVNLVGGPWKSRYFGTVGHSGGGEILDMVFGLNTLVFPRGREGIRLMPKGLDLHPKDWTYTQRTGLYQRAGTEGEKKNTPV